MGFMVRQDAVAAYGKVVGQQAGHSDEAISYLEKHGVVSESAAGLILKAEAFNPTILGIVRDAMTKAQTFCADSADALADTTDYYDGTDQESAAEFDETYKSDQTQFLEKPDLGPPTSGPYGAASHPSEQADPVGRLVAPGTPEKFDDGPFELIKSLNDSISPSYWVRHLIIEASATITGAGGIDPIADAAEKLGGDWEAFAKASAACDQLAKFYQDVCLNIGEYRTLADFWTGNAATAAFTFFYNGGQFFWNSDGNPKVDDCFPDAVPHHWGFYWALTELGKEYMAVAQGVSDLAGAIANVIGALLDATFWAIIGASTAGVTSWTGIGAVLGGAFTGMCVWQIAEKVLEYAGLLGEIDIVLDTFTGLQTAMDGPVDWLVNLTMPKPYEGVS